MHPPSRRRRRAPSPLPPWRAPRPWPRGRLWPSPPLWRALPPRHPGPQCAAFLVPPVSGLPLSPLPPSGRVRPPRAPKLPPWQGPPRIRRLSCSRLLPSTARRSSPARPCSPPGRGGRPLPGLPSLRLPHCGRVRLRPQLWLPRLLPELPPGPRPPPPWRGLPLVRKRARARLRERAISRLRPWRTLPPSPLLRPAPFLLPPSPALRPLRLHFLQLRRAGPPPAFPPLESLLPRDLRRRRSCQVQMLPLLRARRTGLREDRSRRASRPPICRAPPPAQ